jgi:hypothetical protein
MATQAEINAALAAELAARPGTSKAELSAYAQSAYGLTPAQIDAAYASLGSVATPVSNTVNNDLPSEDQNLSSSNQAKTYTDAEVAKALNDLRYLDPNASVQDIITAAATYGVPKEQVVKNLQSFTYSTENVDKLANQNISQNTTSAWTGGLDPKTAARYMADDLAKSGITDISQVGKGDNGIINTVTGEKLVSGYGERTGGNLFSGSYEGKGNTGFGVQFDAQGNPVFFTQGASSSTLKNDLLKLAAVSGAIYGLGGFDGLFGGAATAGVTGANGAFLGEGALSGIAASDAALAGATVGSTGLTMSQLAQLDMALGGAGGTAGATSLANALMTGASIPTITALTGGSGAGLLSNLTSGLGGLTNTLGGGTGATTLGTNGATTLGAGGATGALTTGATGATGALTTGLTNALTNTGVSTAVNTLLNNKNLPNLISGGLGTAGNLLQMQASKEAAQRAQAMIDAETAAAKQAAQFRPVGMTTRFGTSQFQVDPVTGQITSAGYTLSPGALQAQDRLVALGNQGLAQAEQAQAQFAPLQTGAQNLFNLGNQYIAQSPEQVAQNYMNQQLALLQPGRELELANLQNKLQQQGRGGLSVAQGGNLGATTPELQALYNARAQQEAQLAAQAQQAGQQQVTFGAGLLGQGANAMGQYYGGQTAAYQPYTTALGQVQALEAAAQQPFAMGASLGQQASTAGARVGALGLEGANISQRLATGANATTNPYAQLLGAAGNPNAMFGSTINSMLGGLFGTTPVNALDSSAYGTGVTGFQNMLNDIYG